MHFPQIRRATPHDGSPTQQHQPLHPLPNEEVNESLHLVKDLRRLSRGDQVRALDPPKAGFESILVGRGIGPVEFDGLGGGGGGCGGGVTRGEDDGRLEDAG